MEAVQDLEQIVAECMKLYENILNDATDMLRTLDTTSPTAMTEAVQRRQSGLELLGDFNARLACIPSGGDNTFAGFRMFQEDVSKKILEIDGLVIALLREKQCTIMGKLASLSKSATAFQAYGKKGKGQRLWLNDVM